METPTSKTESEKSINWKAVRRLIYTALLVTGYNAPNIFIETQYKPLYDFSESENLKIQIEQIAREYIPNFSIHEAFKFSNPESETTAPVIGLEKNILYGGRPVNEILKLSNRLQTGELQGADQALVIAMLKVDLSLLIHEDFHHVQANKGLKGAREYRNQNEGEVFSRREVIKKSALYLTQWQHFIPYSFKSAYAQKTEFDAVHAQTDYFREKLALKSERLDQNELLGLLPYFVYGIFSDQINNVFPNDRTQEMIALNNAIGEALREDGSDRKEKGSLQIHALTIMIFNDCIVQSDSKTMKRLQEGLRQYGLSEDEIADTLKQGESLVTGEFVTILNEMEINSERINNATNNILF